eukprot:symbB.v1.2.029720.t1/scaffold3287.1/size59763/7
MGCSASKMDHEDGVSSISTECSWKPVASDVSARRRKTPEEVLEVIMRSQQSCSGSKGTQNGVILSGSC